MRGPRDELAAALVVGAGAALRLRSAWGTFVAPDEAIVLEIASAGTVAEVWSASLSNPHPPLVYLALSGWLQAGRGDLWVRLLPVLLTSLGLWLAWRSVRALAGRARALVALTLLAALPSLVPTTTEVRPYPLFLLLAAATVESLRRSTTSVDGAKREAALGFAAFAALGVASHYTAMLLLAGLLPWALARMRRHPRRVRGQLGLLAPWAVPALALGFFWIGHLSHQVSAGVGGALVEATYGSAVYVPGQGGPVHFLVRRIWHLFAWLGGSPPAGALLAIAFAAGVVRLLRRRDATVLLVLGPLAAGAAVALLGRHPFGGFRQSAYLLFPVVLGIAAGAPRALLRHGRLLAPAAVVLAWGVVALAPAKAPSGLPKSMQARADLDEGLAFVTGERSPGTSVLADLGSSVVLAWYHGDPAVDYWKPGPRDPLDVTMGGSRVRIGRVWSYGGVSLRRDLEAVRSEEGERGDVRLFAVWPSRSLVGELAGGEEPGGPGDRPRWFGRGILVSSLAGP